MKFRQRIRSDGEETKKKIITCAGRLMAEKGFAAVTSKEICESAGVNTAAVNYHFGSKDALVQAVFRRRLTALNQERLAELDRLEGEAGGTPLRPSGIVEAFFGTALRMAADTEHGGHSFMRLLARTYNEPNAFVREFLAEEYAEVMDRFLGALFVSLPEVPRAEILWRFHFMTGAMAFAISGLGGLYELAGLSATDDDPQRLLPRLMSFLLGGLRAPLPGANA